MINSKKGTRLLFIIAIICTFFAVIEGNFFGEKLSLQIGEVSPKLILAPFKIENEVATERKRVLAEQSIEEIYTIDQAVEEKAIEDVEELFNYVSAVKEVMASQDPNMPESITSIKHYDIEPNVKTNPVDTLQSKSPVLLYSDEYETLLAASESDLDTLQAQIIELLLKFFEEGVKPYQNRSSEIRKAIESEMINPLYQKLAYEIISSQLKTNIVIDEVATEATRKKAREQIESVYILQNEKIIGQGSRVTEENYLLLEKAGFLDTDVKNTYTQYLGVSILLGVIILCLFRYIKIRKTLEELEFRQIGLFFMLYLISLLLIHILKPMNFIYIPLSIAPMLIAILIKPDIAIIFNLVLIILAAIIQKGDVVFVVYLMLTGIMSILVVTGMQERKQTMKSALIVGLMHALIYSSLQLLIGIPPTGESLFEGIQTFLMGLISVILVVGSLPLWEAGFGFITPIQLLELTNPNQPILKRLLIEATGTYYHSLLVANLAETAADEIGANTLLARVGGYYHDIGKLTCSNYFKENQVLDNPHDYLEPRASANIIISHVTAGIDLANEYKLPECIKDMIIQHHGTSTMQFFYIKAKEVEDNPIKIKDFQYPGPKPLTREAALVMLADVVEATVRSMQHKIGVDMTVEQIVKKMVKQKLDEGELDNCPLYISDIDKIVSSFTRMLKGMYHERIEYPEKKG
ncbi:MAG: HDIG domain-containing protein [Cellulosilyticaceae bacterium]